MATASTHTPPASRVRQVGTAAAIATGIALLSKVVLIVVTTNAISPTVTSVLYLVGVALPLVAAAGIASGHGPLPKRAGIYIGVILAHLFFIVALSDGVGALVEIFTDEAYLTDEIPVAVLGLIWLLAGVHMRTTDRE